MKRNWFKMSNTSFIHAIQHFFLSVWCFFIGVLSMIKGKNK